jgi:hypothetical protein
MNEATLELPENTRCEKCGYSIHALTVDRCPECGSAFDRRQILANLSRKKTKKPYDKKAARMLAAPSWWVVLLASGPLLLVWYPPSSIGPRIDRNMDFSGYLLAALVLCLSVGLLLLKAFDHVGASRDYILDKSQMKWRGKSWIALLFLCLFNFAILFSMHVGGEDFRFRVLFELNKPAMDRLAQRTVAAHAGQPDQQVGWFRAVWIDSWPDGMSFREGDPEGSLRFFYSTTGNPPTYIPYAERLDSHWFWYARD